MDFALIVFIVLLVLTIFNNGVQAYIHFEAYPLLAYVGKDDFPAYLEQYENRLNIPLLLPYALTVLSNIALIFARPDGIEVIGVIIVLVLNLSVAATSIKIATPVYEEVKQAGTAKIEAMSRLMKINLARLLISTAASLVLIYMLATLLT